eukprot:m.140333 g.140333  ORF g.140333 m.140333 type:complete len:73 (+) comp10011_c1_seq1:103-321(+)
MSLLAILETAVRLLATFVIMLAVISGCWIILYKVVLSQFPIFREVLWGEGADQHQQSDKDRPPSTPATPKRD